MEKIYSGICDEEEKISWHFNCENNTLLIQGSGELFSNEALHIVPWFSHREDILKVIIKGEFTYINPNIFEGCEYIEDFYIADEVKGISGPLFYYTDFFENEDNWEDDVLYVGNHLIEYRNKETKSYKIKEGTVDISSAAFTHIHILKELYIPKSVRNIDEKAFLNADDLDKITVDEENEFYCDDNARAILTKDKKLLIHHVPASSKKEYYVPEEVTEISSFTFFNCKNLKKIIIGKNVRKLYAFSFATCKKLNSISISPENEYLTTDDYGVVYSKDKKQLIFFPGFRDFTEYEIDERTEEILSSAFLLTRNLDRIIIKGNKLKFNGDAFNSNLYSITAHTAPDYEYFVKANSDSKTVIIPESVKYIGKDSFRTFNPLLVFFNNVILEF